MNNPSKLEHLNDRIFLFMLLRLKKMLVRVRLCSKWCIIAAVLSALVSTGVSYKITVHMTHLQQ